MYSHNEFRYVLMNIVVHTWRITYKGCHRSSMPASLDEYQADE
jgi:hypothetical protein